jgi:hypothetical protein
MLNLNVINTPDRRKSQQLCHANMLKQYIISCSVDSTGKPSVGVLTELTFWPDISSLGTYRNELSERPLAGTGES